jgi:hypothetical protein
VAGERGVGDDDAVYPPGRDFQGDVVEIAFAEIGCDLEKDRDARRRRGSPRFANPLQQCFQFATTLQIAQAGRIGRRDVDGQIGGEPGETGNAGRIVADPVFGFLVGADIDADDAGLSRARGQPFRGGRMPLIVEAEPVDHRLVLAQPEDARSGVSGLRQRRYRADFCKAEAEPQQRVGHLGVLVEACRHAEWIGEGQSRDGGCKPRIGFRPSRQRQAGFQRRDRQAVGRFRVEAEQRPLPQPVDKRLHGTRSGNSCRPSGPSGSGFTQSTPAGSSGA